MRKPVFVVGLCLAFLCSCGTSKGTDQSEQSGAIEPAVESATDVLIEFPNITWGSTHEYVEEDIPDTISTSNAYILYPNSVFDYNQGVLDGGVILTGDFDMWGYSAISVLYFTYGVTDGGGVDKSSDNFYLSSSQIISNDSAAAYEDICNRLEALYGVGTETVTEHSSVSYSLETNTASAEKYPVYETIWYGLNSSFAVVQYTADGDTEWIFVAFGLQDAVDTLDAIAAS